eukprot:3270496-Amphidinium_carterae.1
MTPDGIDDDSDIELVDVRPLRSAPHNEDSTTMNALMLLDVTHETIPIVSATKVEHREEEKQTDIPTDIAIPVETREVVRWIREGRAT